MTAAHVISTKFSRPDAVPFPANRFGSFPFSLGFLSLMVNTDEVTDD